MSGGSSDWDALADVERLKKLAALMRDHDLSELELSHGELLVRLKRPTEPVAVVSAPRAAAPVAAAPPAAAAAPAADNLHVIRSPMVGTFYAASSPDASPYVKVGDHVGPDTTVCIIEAMKVFNEIPAEISGKVAAVLVKTGEPVEYGQPLFKIDTKG